MIGESSTVIGKGTYQWFLTEDEINSVGESPLSDDYFDDEEHSVGLDIADLAIRGDVAGVQREVDKYLTLAKKQAASKSQTIDSVGVIDKYSNETKAIMIQAVNLIANKPDKTPKLILTEILNKNDKSLDSLSQYQQLTGNRLLREIRDASDLSVRAKDNLVINPSVTLTGLLNQVRKNYGYVATRVVKADKSSAGKNNRKKRHQLILEYKSQGMTQVDVAKILGVSDRTVKRFWNKPVVD